MRQSESREEATRLPVPSVEELIRLSDALNRAWKHLRDRHGSQHPIPALLRLRKAEIQLRLIRAHPDRVRLVPHHEEGDEPLLSVRIEPPAVFEGRRRGDANHLPLRIAKKLLSEEEQVVWLSEGSDGG